MRYHHVPLVLAGPLVLALGKSPGLAKPSLTSSGCFAGAQLPAHVWRDDRDGGCWLWRVEGLVHAFLNLAAATKCYGRHRRRLRG